MKMEGREPATPAASGLQKADHLSEEALSQGAEREPVTLFRQDLAPDQTLRAAV